MSQILVFVDTLWEYKYIVNYINYILERINVCKHGSTVQILTTSHADVLVSQTSSILTVYQNWSSTKHSQYGFGFNFPKILKTIQQWAFSSYNNGDDNENGFPALRSHIVLIVPSASVFVPETEINFCHKLLKQIHELLPNVQVIFFAGGAITRFMDFVKNPKEDLYPLNIYLDFESTAKPVVKRIQNVARSIRLPICRLSDKPSLNSSLSQQGHLQDHKKHIEIEQCIQPKELIFYYVSLRFNHMKRSDMENSFIQIKTGQHIIFTICTSTTNPRPQRNFTKSHSNHLAECHQLLSTSFNISLKDLCVNNKASETCPLLFFSVEAPQSVDIQNLYCKAQNCSLPQSLTFSIVLNNFECNGSRNLINEISFLLYLIYTIYIIF